VTLPVLFSADDIDPSGHVVLETVAEVPPEWAGGPVTVAVPMFYGPAALTAGGRPAPSNELGMAHAFRIDEAARAGGSVPLGIELDARYAPALTGLIRISATEQGDPSFLFVRDFNFVSTLVAMSTGWLLAVLYVVVFAFDRRRREYGWLAVLAVAGPVLMSGDTGPPRATVPWLLYAIFCASGIYMVATIGFLRSYFTGRGLSWKWIPAAFLPAALLAAIRTPAALLAAYNLLAVAALAFAVYGIVLVARQLRRPATRFSAATLSIAFGLVQFCALPEFVANSGHGEYLDGLRTCPLGLVIVYVGLTMVVGRDLIRSLRETDARVKEAEARGLEIGQLNEDLRHQVAERSRELTEVLARSEGYVAPPSLEPGDVFDGRYRVARALGKGGMGAVYEVERLRDGRRFALKVLTNEVSSRVAARFAREAEIGARIRHDNVVSIVDVGIGVGATPFLVMELVQGGSLEEQRKRFGEAKWALPILRQIAAGLAELHAHQIIHRDLKPGNVLLVGGNGVATPVAKISDFGISRFGALDDSAEVDVEGATMVATGREESPDDLTQTGALLGTPVYMPPEALHGAVRSPSADVFSLGVLAYEAITGRLPFAIPPVLSARARQPILQPAVLEAVPEAIATLVLACLHVDPAQRPRARQVADGL
jgi:tRNA A-37 threonylcarbamoyl transferase component Bud32